MTDIAHQSKSASVGTKKRKPEAPAAKRRRTSNASPMPNFPLPVELFGEIRPLLNRRWLVKGLLMTGASTVIFGSPGAGKSFFAIDIALHVAPGRAWFDRDVTQGGVVYVAAEGQAGIRNRKEAWKKANGIDAELQFALIPTAIDLLDPEADFEKLNQTVAMLEKSWGSIVLIVIDTVAATFGGGDENGHDMTTYVSNVARLCKPYNCASAIVTHVPLNASGSPRPRGHSSLLGAMDTAIYVRDASSKGSRIAKITKQKDDDPGNEIRFRLQSVEIGTSDDGEPVTSCRLVPDERSMGNRRDGKPVREHVALAFTTLMATIETAGVELTDAFPGTEAGWEHMPRACLVSEWKTAFMKASRPSDASPDTLRKRFERSRETLIGTKNVGSRGKYAWLID